MSEAKATGHSLGISTKYAIEICAYLRGKKTIRAKNILERVLAKKEAIPFKRFTDGVGHRSGNLTSGRYPVKASEAILGLINSAEANAVNKGLAGELIIKELRANKAASPMHGGRQSRREMKRTHVYITVAEATTKVKKVKSEKTEVPKAVETKVKVEKPETKAEKPKAVVKTEKPKEAVETKTNVKEEKTSSKKE